MPARRSGTGAADLSEAERHHILQNGNALMMNFPAASALSRLAVTACELGRGMGWPDWLLSAGLLVGVAGAALTFREVQRRLWPAREPPQPKSARYVEGVGVLVSQAMIFGGMALIQFGSVAGHINDNTRPANLGLSFVGSAAVVLLFGVQLGRLALRA
jgi:hypothetical protein